MAYAPSVNDNSGQIMAQGIQGFGQQLAQGLQDYQKHKVHNQALQGENEGIINALTTNPDLAKYLPQDSQKLLEKKMKAGGLSLADSAKLNGYLTAGVKTYQMDTQMKLQQAQIAEANAQAQQRMAMARQAAQEGEWMQRINGPAGTPPDAPQAQMQQTGPSVAVSDNVAAMMQQTPSQAVSPQAQIAPQGRAAQVSAPPQGVGSSFYGPGRSQIPTPNIDMLKRAIAMGAPAHVIASIKKVADTELAQVNEERKLQEQKINKIEFEKNGRTYVRTVNAMTGEVLGEAPVNALVKSVQDEKDFHLFKTANDSAEADLKVLSTDAEQARIELADIGRMRELVSKYGATTQWGDEIKTEMANAWASITGEKNVRIGSQQEFFALIQRQIVNSSRAIKGQGAITGTEREMTGKTAARAGLSIDANLAILDNVEKLHKRTVMLRSEANKLRRGGKTPAEIAMALEDLRDTEPVFWGKDTPAPKSDPNAPVSGGNTVSADPQEGFTATNPKTGQKMIKQNGKWEPIK